MKVRLPTPDGVWRFGGRGVVDGIHPSIDSQDCYLFVQRTPCESGDYYTSCYIPVTRFWAGTAVTNADSCGQMSVTEGDGHD